MLELTETRLTRIVYLADWKSALERRRPLTSIRWRFEEGGPSSAEVRDLIRQDLDFEFRVNAGEPLEFVHYKGTPNFTSLEDGDKQILDFVIDKSATKDWTEFTKLVYSTFPILTQPRYSLLDLLVLAKEYKNRDCLLRDAREACSQAS